VNTQKKPFGKTPDGRDTDLYTLTNDNKMQMQITNYGGIIVSLCVPDRNGQTDDVVLGSETLRGYLKSTPYFGAIVGRCANRIGKAAFTLNGREHHLAANDGPNHLHGGITGFDKKLWKAEPLETKNAVSLKLTYLSKDGEEAYPGNLTCTVTYTLTNDNELKIDYHAEADRTTICNLTNHSYFNLAGQGNGDILNHQMLLNANWYTPVNERLIPTGEIKSVHETPMDFTRPHTIGSRIDQVPGGYDHNYVLNKKERGSLSLAARVFEPTSGRIMELYTTQPGTQFYTGNFLDGSITGKAGKVYKKHYGFCLETQHLPDSINKPHFPSVILQPNEEYQHLTIYKFAVN